MVTNAFYRPTSLIQGNMFLQAWFILPAKAKRHRMAVFTHLYSGELVATKYCIRRQYESGFNHIFQFLPKTDIQLYDWKKTKKRK